MLKQLRSFLFNWTVYIHLILNVPNISSLRIDPSTPTVTALDVTTSTISVNWTSDDMIILSHVRVARSDGGPPETNIMIPNNGVFLSSETRRIVISNLQSGVRYNVYVTVHSADKSSKEGVLTQITSKFLHLSW